MWLVDFGGFFTKDSGAVGGFRCDPAPGNCANGAKKFPGSGVSGAQYGIGIEQGAGTSILRQFAERHALVFAQAGAILNWVETVDASALTTQVGEYLVSAFPSPMLDLLRITVISYS
jgi:hypothetical protein